MTEIPPQRYASAHIIGWVRALRGLEARHKAVLYSLATFCDDTHEGTSKRKRWASCFPSQETIGKCAGLSVRSVRRVLGELEELGLVTVEAHRGGTPNVRADRRPNLYTLSCPRPRPDVGDRADVHDQSSVERRPVTDGTTTGHPGSHDRSQVTDEGSSEGSSEGSPEERTDDVADEFDIAYADEQRRHRDEQARQARVHQENALRLARFQRA